MYDTTMSAIVLDGHLKSALCTVRSLGRKGIPIAAGAVRTTAMALHSRFVTERFMYTSPEVHKEKFVAEIIAEAKKIFLEHGEKPVVYCFSDATCLSLSEARDRIGEYAILPLPSFASIETASDKKATYELAARLLVPTILTYAEEDFDDVTYPAVVKNRHSIVWEGERSHLGSAFFVFSKEELFARYEKVTKETGEAPLVQKCILGEEYGIEMLCNEGEVLQQFAHKRIRSLSPRGGAAVVKETAEETEEVLLMRKYAHSLAQELLWTGPIMVEFKIDTQNGQVLLMEINGRFWGSLPLAVKAGVDFPLAYYDLALGEAVQPTQSFLVHVRTRHFLGDVKWILRVMFAKDNMRKFLYPSFFRASWEFKTELFRSKSDIFDARDLCPSLFEYVDILNKIWK